MRRQQHLKATCDLFTTPSLCMSFSIWTTHWAPNGSISRFHLGTFTPSYLFHHVLWRDIWDPLCPNFIMFWPKGRHVIYNSISLPNLSIIFPNFLHNSSYMTLTTPSFNYKHPLMCAHTSHRPYGYSPLTLCSWQQTHWNPWCNEHHFCCHCIRCVFPRGTRTIVCASFNHIQQVNIVLTKDGICTLANVIIANPMRTNWLPRSCATQGFVASNAAQVKEKSYRNWHPTD